MIPSFVCGNPFFKGCESQVEAAFRIAKFPGFHIIAGNVIKFDLLQFMDAVPKDQGILSRFRQVAKATAQVQADGASIR